MKKIMFFASVMGFCLEAISVRAEVTPFIEQNLTGAALNNILNSEKVFCYTVEKATRGYTGYTLDTLALTGYCGQLKEEKSVFIKEFFETPEHVLQKKDPCSIEPKIMLRFIRGVDATDVLFSDTCPSVTVFYGGKVQTFNEAPAKKSLEAVVKIFSAGRTDFVSPALLDEVMPNGVVLNDEQKALVNKQKTAQPVRRWEKKNQPESAPKAQESAKGWNRLKNN